MSAHQSSLLVLEEVSWCAHTKIEGSNYDGRTTRPTHTQNYSNYDGGRRFVRTDFVSLLASAEG